MVRQTKVKKAEKEPTPEVVAEMQIDTVTGKKPSLADYIQPSDWYKSFLRKRDPLEEEPAPASISVEEQVEGALLSVQNNKFNVKAWELIFEHLPNKKVADARSTYELFFQTFPTASMQWKAWIEHELAENNESEAQNLFDRCLRTNLHVDLWRTYLRFVGEQMRQRSPKEEIEGMIKAFEFALEHVGYDVDSVSIWGDYIEFLSGRMQERVASKQGEVERNKTLGHTFKRLFSLPIFGADKLWDDYLGWKQEQKPKTGGSHSQVEENYPHVRALASDRHARYEGLNRNLLCVPMEMATDETNLFRAKFREIFPWECVLHLPDMRPDLWQGYLSFVCQQAVSHGYLWEDYWIMSGEVLLKQGAVKEADRLLAAGCEALPGSLNVYLRHARLLEENSEGTQAISVLDRAVSRNPRDVRFCIAALYLRRRVQGPGETRAFYDASFKTLADLMENRDGAVAAEKQTVARFHELVIAMSNMEWKVNKNADEAKRVLLDAWSLCHGSPAYVGHLLRLLDALGDDVNMNMVFMKSVGKSESIDSLKEFLDPTSVAETTKRRDDDKQAMSEWREIRRWFLRTELETNLLRNATSLSDLKITPDEMKALPIVQTLYPVGVATDDKVDFDSAFKSYYRPFGQQPSSYPAPIPPNNSSIFHCLRPDIMKKLVPPHRKWLVEGGDSATSQEEITDIQLLCFPLPEQVRTLSKQLPQFPRHVSLSRRDLDSAMHQLLGPSVKKRRNDHSEPVENESAKFSAAQPSTVAPLNPSSNAAAVPPRPPVEDIYRQRQAQRMRQN
jgi:tetratricopeptide (TPR) repeat protein